MVISMTSAVLTRTQAVSPEFTADAAAAGAGVAATAAVTVVAASSARAGNAPASAIPIPINPLMNPSLFISPPFFVMVSVYLFGDLLLPLSVPREDFAIPGLCVKPYKKGKYGENEKNCNTVFMIKRNTKMNYQRSITHICIFVSLDTAKGFSYV
jgi:hypothetical protein